MNPKGRGDEDPVPRAQNSSRNRSREANMEAPCRDPGKADSKVVRDAQTWEHGGQHHRNCPLVGCTEREKAGIPVVWRGTSQQGIRILTQTHWVGGDGRQTGGYRNLRCGERCRLQTDFRAIGIEMICKAVMLSAERVPREQCEAREDKMSTPGCPTLEGGEKRRHH